jgi:DNA repair exonuclease SbcCD ATPase subunit
MSWFRKTPRTPEELAQIRAEIRKLHEAMDRHEQRATALTNTLSAQPDWPGLVGRVDALDQTFASRDDDQVSSRLDAMAEQLSNLDARITSVSRELANQITELGHDIDGLQKRVEAEPAAEEVIDGVRDAQERLASEQARYQIAFREDLARLAEQLRRARS